MTTDENHRQLFSLSQETLEVPLYEPVSNWANAVSPENGFGVLMPFLISH
jgi:hypothetical protein